MAILNMVGGGGGGLKSTDAILRVIAPAGSTVTISKGVVSKSDQGHENASDTSLYDYYFIIHASQFDSVNPWTVTATLGAQSKTETIIINSAEEYDVVIAYAIYFVKDGVIDTALTSEMTGGSITQKSGYVRFATGPSAVAFFDASVNSNFSTIVLEVVNSGNESWHGNQCPAIGYSASKPIANNSNGAVSPYTAYTNLNNIEGTIQATTYTVAANATGTNWVWLCLSGTNNRSCHVDVYNFYIT